MKKIKIEDLKEVIYMKEVSDNVNAVIEFCEQSFRITKKWHRVSGSRIIFPKNFTVEFIDLSDNELTLFKKLWKNEK